MTDKDLLLCTRAILFCGVWDGTSVLSKNKKIKAVIISSSPS